MAKETHRDKNPEASVAMKEAGAASAWLIVRPQAGKERLLLQVAPGEGFECYRPILLRERHNPILRQATVVTVPMFPGYVLMRSAPAKSYRVFSLPGVQPGEGGVLKRALLEPVVREIRSREKNGIIECLEPKAVPKRGQKIKTLGGLIDAIIAEPVDMNRVVILTDMFKGSARVTCSLDQVIRH